jgi:hypothetical protein
MRRSAFILPGVVGLFACRTLQSGEILSPRELALIRADSEVFAAVVHPQVEVGAKVELYRYDSLRIDPRPYGAHQDFDEAAGGNQGFDPSGLFTRPDSATMRRLAQSRSRILKSYGVPEGMGFDYPRCGGTLAPPPPPPPSQPASTPQPAKAIPSGPRRGCPAASENYLTVGIPVRGEPESLRKFNARAGLPTDVGGELWTVIVDEQYVGPSGQNRFQYAWLLRRNPATNQLALIEKILLSWAE